MTSGKCLVLEVRLTVSFLRGMGMDVNSLRSFQYKHSITITITMHIACKTLHRFVVRVEMKENPVYLGTYLRHFPRSIGNVWRSGRTAIDQSLSFSMTTSRRQRCRNLAWFAICMVLVSKIDYPSFQTESYFQEQKTTMIGPTLRLREFTSAQLEPPSTPLPPPPQSNLLGYLFQPSGKLILCSDSSRSRQ